MLRGIYRLAILCLLFVSCEDRKIISDLRKVDDLVMQRHEIYDDYERSLQPLKTRLHLADTDFQKWELADSLHSAYEHFSLDSTLEYIRLQHHYAVTPRQEYASLLNEVKALAYRHNETQAENIFLSLDTLEVRKYGLDQLYLQTGITLYNYIYIYSRHLSREESAGMISNYRERYAAVDTLSYYGKKNLMLMAKQRGEYCLAIDMLLNMRDETRAPHDLSSIYYNLAQLYDITAQEESRLYSLIKSVEYDFMCPVRNYLSLYELALVLYDRGMLQKAGEYISANLSDAIAGNFNIRMINSGKHQMIISEAAKQENIKKLYWLILFLSFIAVLFVIMCVLFAYNRRYVRRLREIKNVLLETNARLKRVNKDLSYANKIKDSYVFSYMELSINYLGKIENTRREIKSIAKNEGLEAVLKYLRSPSEIYEEYRRYYKVFDEAFLGIFPDFREKVNALLKEEARFPISSEPVLCTELRMLAAIRLGIRESGKIAVFLNCAPTTVYTYRTRLKRAALCEKDDFDTIVASL